MLAGRTLPPRREYLFGSRLDDATARGLIARMGRESPLAQYQLTLPRRARPSKAPVLVLGSPDDRLMPLADVRQVAEHYGAELRLFPGMGHDLMLDAGWQEPLDALLDWVEATVPSRPRAAGGRVVARVSG